MSRLTALRGSNHRPLIVAALSDPRRLLPDARKASRDGADILEIRADMFPRVLLHPEPLRDLLEAVRRAVRKPLLLTLRLPEEGGQLSRHFREQDRLNLFRAALSEVDMVDVELCANDINHHVIFEAHKRGRAVIVSHHDYRRTPSDNCLKGLARKAKRLEGDVLKVAAHPRKRQEVERFMEFCRRCALRRRAFLPMGPLGKDARRNGFQWGSCLTYGHVGRATAPGQPSVKELAAAIKP